MADWATSMSQRHMRWTVNQISAWNNYDPRSALWHSRLTGWHQCQSIFLPVSSAATVCVRALVMTTFCVVSPTTNGRHTKHSCNTLLTWAWNKYQYRFQLSKVNTEKRGDTAAGSQHLHRYLFHCLTRKIPSLIQNTEIYSSIHYTYTDTFIKYLQLFTAPMRIPLFIHYTCMNTFIHSLHPHGYLYWFTTPT